jgi:hypothetical protein
MGVITAAAASAAAAKRQHDAENDGHNTPTHLSHKSWIQEQHARMARIALEESRSKRSAAIGTFLLFSLVVAAAYCLSTLV